MPNSLVHRSNGLAVGVRSYLCRTVPKNSQLLLQVQRRPSHTRRPSSPPLLASSNSGYKHRADEVMDGFSLITDHNLLLQSRGMFDGGTDASMFAAADGYASVASYSSESRTVRTEEEQRNKGKDLFFCGLPELGGFDDFETNMRSHGATDFLPKINATHSTNIQQQTRSDGRNHTPSSYEAHAISSSGEIDQFSLVIDAELFGPFDDNITSTKQTGGCEGLEAIICSNRKMQAPTASRAMLPDESVVISSTCSGPDLFVADISCSKRKLHGTPDMLLEGMAENPLEMYFPLLTTFEQPEVLISEASTQTYEEFAGSTSAPNCAGMQFCSKDMSSAELHEQPRSTLILEAVPVKDLSFHKLQNGMHQMDVATKGRIRDALYRLANSVEQRHYIASTSGLVAGSSGSKRFRSGRWTETQANPMDQSVAQLLLQKPPYRNTVSSSRVTYSISDGLVSCSAVVAEE